MYFTRMYTLHLSYFKHSRELPVHKGGRYVKVVVSYAS